MKKNSAVLATLAALFAQIIFGFSFMFTKIALGFASPFTVMAGRHAVALLGLTAVILITKTKIKLSGGIWKLVLMAFFQPIMYFVFEAYGILYSTSAFSSVMISLVPVVAMLCGIFTLKEIPSKLQYAFTALTVAGVVIMAYAGKTDGSVTPMGILLLFGAVVSAVAYNIASRKISAQFSATQRTYAMVVVGTIGFVILSLLENGGNIGAIFTPFANTQYLLSMLYLGIASSVAAFLMLNFANTHLPVSKTTVFANATTIVSVLAGVIFLGEPFSVYSLISTVMIIIGVCGVQLQKVKIKKGE